MYSKETAAVLRCFPQVYFACHTRHIRVEPAGTLLSAHQASVLDHLDDVECTSLLQLAAHMGVTSSTMSITVDRLERAGHVRRERSSEDGRRLDLRLTPSGARVKREHKVLNPERVALMLGYLNPKGRIQATKALELLAAAAGQMMAARSPGRKKRSGAA